MKTMKRECQTERTMTFREVEMGKNGPTLRQREGGSMAGVQFGRGVD